MTDVTWIEFETLEAIWLWSDWRTPLNPIAIARLVSKGLLERRDIAPDRHIHTLTAAGLDAYLRFKRIPATA